MVSKKPKEEYKYLKVLFFLTNPLFLMVFFNFTALLFFFITPQDLMLSFAEEKKYFSFHALLLYISFTLSFIFGYWTYPKKLHKTNYEKVFFQIKILMKTIKLFAYITFFLTLIGYLLWFKEIYFNFGYYLNILFQEGAYYTRNILLEHMLPGITTFTQFGIISSMLFLILYLFRRKKKYLFTILIIVLLSIIRALFFGERLAVLEIIIPLTYIYLRFVPYRLKLFIFLGLFLFTILWSSELLRSYMSPSYYEKYSPIEFLFYRFTMYFTTTINNAFLIFDKFEPFQDLFPETGKFFYHLIHYYPKSNEIYKNLLDTYLNPEYNNKSAWGSIYFDWGFWGIFISFLIGTLSRYFYIQYRMNTLWGILIYPIFMTFLLQSYRVLYINSSRIIYPYVIVLLLYIVYQYKQSKMIMKKR